MTLIVGLCSPHGVVMAADSKAISKTPGQTTTLEMDKLWQIRTAAVVAGVSGHVGFAQDLRDELNAKITNPRLKKRISELAPDLQRETNRVMRTWHKDFIQLTPQDQLQVATLIGGFTDGKPWLLEIDANGLHQRHEELGFAAIGSGGAFAYHARASFEHFDLDNSSLEQLKALAYKTVDGAIRAASLALGPPVQIWTVDQSGARRLDENELKAVEDLVNIWKALEAETLREALGEASSEEG